MLNLRRFLKAICSFRGVFNKQGNTPPRNVTNKVGASMGRRAEENVGVGCKEHLRVSAMAVFCHTEGFGCCCCPPLPRPHMIEGGFAWEQETLGLPFQGWRIPVTEWQAWASQAGVERGSCSSSYVPGNLESGEDERCKQVTPGHLLCV